MTKPPRIPALLLTTLLLSMTGCAKQISDNAALWKSAMTDAVFSEDEEIHNLVELTKDDAELSGTDQANTFCCLYHRRICGMAG